MNSEAIAGISISRPKIHRPPSFARSRNKYLAFCTDFFNRGMATRPLVFTLGAVVAMIGLVMLMNGFTSLVAFHVGKLPRLHHALASGGVPGFVPLDSKALVTIGDAQATTSETLVLTGDNGSSIVGQMAKLPTHNEQLGDIKTMSQVDNTTRRELLSIINKY